MNICEKTKLKSETADNSQIQISSEGIKYCTDPKRLVRDEMVYSLAETNIKVHTATKKNLAPNLATIESTVQKDAVNNQKIEILPEKEMTHSEAVKIVSDYYAGDTLDAEMAAATVSTDQNHIQTRLNSLSQAFDEELKKQPPNNEVLQSLIYPLMMLMFRRSAQIDQEFISELGVKIQVQAVEIKDGHNSWHGIAITITASAIGIVGGGLSFAQLIPGIAPGLAQTLAASAQPVSGTSTAISSIGGIFDNKRQGTLGFLQMQHERSKTKEENSRSAKRTTNESVNSTKETWARFTDEFFRFRRELVSG